MLKSARLALCLSVLLLLVGPSSLWAVTVGFLSQVEGKVDILRQGKPPAVPAQVRDQVDAGDLIRTKSLSRAQIRFVDDTVLTIAPGSLVAIDNFLFDAAQPRRQAVLQVLRGLVNCLVQRLYQLEEPDFLIKTFTATLGVRGTRWFTLVGVNYVGGFVETGLVEMSSVLPHRQKKVLITGGEYSFTLLHQDPLDPKRYSLETLNLLRQWLVSGVPPLVLQSDPLSIPWEGKIEGQILPPGLEQLISPKEIPEGLFVPPTLRPLPPVQPPSHSGGIYP